MKPAANGQFCVLAGRRPTYQLHIATQLEFRVKEGYGATEQILYFSFPSSIGSGGRNEKYRQVRKAMGVVGKHTGNVTILS